MDIHAVNETLPQETFVEILSKEQTQEILQILMLGITPAISLLGIVGNTFSILVLARQGLHKCSNILLISLAVSDITFLIGFNSVPKLIYEIVSDVEGFPYVRSVSYFLYVLYQIFHIMDYGSGGVSLTLPMLITVERLVAVFLPLHFKQIVTPSRTWTAVCCFTVFWYIFFIHMSFFLTFEYETKTEYNISFGLIKRSAYHYAHLDMVAMLEESMSYVYMRIPPVFTLVGCLVIGVRMKVVSVKRQAMMSKNSKEASNNRTTKMLLAVCSVYTVACGILSLPTYIPQYLYYTMTSDAPSNLGRIMYQVINIALCINSSCNFVIYVVMNKTFRDTYKSIFMNKTFRGTYKSIFIFQVFSKTKIK
ncbi:probable G-protein coupled receptor frpr-1 [Physella acuta]|uniref:probable G-protein coupled receptor frpr-1 n=1 Tax=Physella acuta TaxID=109671 RepID=UPI0027DD2D13|nr:probable G-protein coupled receptor frpr-1 [Physella acuta]